MDKLVAHYLTQKRCSWLCQITFFLVSHTEQKNKIHHSENASELVIIA